MGLDDPGSRTVNFTFPSAGGLSLRFCFTHLCTITTNFRDERWVTLILLETRKLGDKRDASYQFVFMALIIAVNVPIYSIYSKPSPKRRSSGV
jgi:hypothetical protein